VIYNKNWQRI